MPKGGDAYHIGLLDVLRKVGHGVLCHFRVVGGGGDWDNYATFRRLCGAAKLAWTWMPL